MRNVLLQTELLVATCDLVVMPSCIIDLANASLLCNLSCERLRPIWSHHLILFCWLAMDRCLSRGRIPLSAPGTRPAQVLASTAYGRGQTADHRF